MANSHFGNLGDVWKHLVLAEVLEREPPRWYAETHAGSAAYPLNRDPQREFGIWRFLAAAPRSAELARSRYYAIAGSCASARMAIRTNSIIKLILVHLPGRCAFQARSSGLTAVGRS